jgi:5'-methylthioadenosine phosphorylase
VPEATLAFIGGSGLYDLEGLTDVREIEVDTPFGSPSDALVIGTLGDKRVAFLPRHGRGHTISPAELPARANIYALKSLGVERIVSISAVGSLKEEIRPLDLVVPDQLIDRTWGRVNTFFGHGVVAHLAFADPFCPTLSEAIGAAARRQGARTHQGGACVTIQGPQFSTRAESQLFRSWGAAIVGMTALPEARLAREAEICYATMALVTDYDCWHQTEEPVSVDLIVGNLLKNVAVSTGVIRELASVMPEGRGCACGSALKDAIITNRQSIPETVRSQLSLILDKYLQGTEEDR